MSDLLDLNGNKKRKRVAIGLPTTDFVNTDFALCLANFLSFSSGFVDIAMINKKGSLLPKSRHDIVMDAIKINADNVLFIDSDMTFPKDALILLLKANKKVIGCNATSKRPPIQPTCRDLDGKFVDSKLKGVREVGRIGTGFLLVDIDVFKKIGAPYFELKFNGENFIGEDYNFCDKVKATGEKVYCDFDLSLGIGHLGTVAYGL